MPGIYLLGQGSLSWYDWDDRVSRNDASETDYSAGLVTNGASGLPSCCEWKGNIDDGSMPKLTSSPSSSGSAPGLAAARANP